ncbi:hypothetical protein GF362_04295 [Candidatus Dojkabacteria bacterium]|nr:hypothetical protein [Candidatus Dojkabacteria bacterium]
MENVPNTTEEYKQNYLDKVKAQYLRALVSIKLSEGLQLHGDFNKLPTSIDGYDLEEPDLPLSSDSISTVFAQHERNKEDLSQKIQAKVEGIGEISMQVSILDLDQNPDKDMYVVMGGALSPALRTLGAPLAALGNRVMMVPHILNHSVEPVGCDHHTFTEKYYEYDQQNGAYTPDGKFISEILDILRRNGQINGNLHLVGHSAGGGVWMRVAHDIAKNYPELEEQLENVLLIDSIGTYLPKEYRGFKKFLNIGKLIGGFGIEASRALPFIDRDEWLLNIGDAETQPWNNKDWLKSVTRCMSPILNDVSPHVENKISIILAEDGRVISKDKVYECVEQLNQEREEKGQTNIAVMEVWGGHNSPVKRGMEIASRIQHLVEDRPYPDI